MPHRIGISNNEFVVLKKTSEKLYHGYQLLWDELEDDMQRALMRDGLTNFKGKILKSIKR